MELNFEDLEMQKWNIPTDKAQRVDEKNSAISLVIMFTPRVMVSKISKIFFSPNDKKISHCVVKIFKCIQSYQGLSKNDMINIIEGRNIKNCWVSKKIPQSWIV